MTTLDEGLRTDHSQAKKDGAHTHSGEAPLSSRGSRLTSFSAADFPVPTGREEEWRFSAISALQPLFADKLDAAGIDLEVTAAEEVTVETVARGDERLGTVGAPGDRPAALAWENFDKAAVVTIPKNATPQQPTVLKRVGNGAGATAAHIQIRAGVHSESVVVLDHAGPGQLTENVEIILEDGARLTVVTIQEWDEDSIHASAHRAVLGRDAYLKHVVVTLGGKAVRMAPEARFDGPGGEVEMFGVYFTDADQHQEHRLFVDHAVSNCRSDVAYKGALQGEGAHAVWIGDVLIRAAAEGTDTYELNRNLVLTEGARADSVPNLEIETGEIEGAGHASATGRFDDEQVFYLTSRGIPIDEARRLVVRGFFVDVVKRIGVAEIEERIMLAIEKELETTAELAAK